MTEKRTANVFWAIVTLVCFFIGSGFLAIIPIICWLCAASNTRKHNAKVAETRHRETLAALRGH